MRARDVSGVAMFVALAVACGYALMAIPNVELITLSVFLGGVFLGPSRGALVGLLSMGLYSGFHPLGAAPLPLLAAQVGTMAVVGAVGGWEAPLLRRCLGGSRGKPALVGGGLLVASGVVLTAVYDTATTVAMAALMAGPGFSTGREGSAGPTGGFWVLLVAGSVFSAVHLVSNALAFGLIGAPAVRALVHWSRRESPDG